MAKTETFTASSTSVKRFAESLNNRGRHPSAPCGPICTITGNEVSMYGGNSGERQKLASILLAQTAAPKTSTPSATQRQIGVLNSLRQQDPGFASTIGMPENMGALTKSAASILIEQMLSNR